MEWRAKNKEYTQISFHNLAPLKLKTVYATFKRPLLLSTIDDRLWEVLSIPIVTIMKKWKAIF